MTARAVKRRSSAAESAGTEDEHAAAAAVSMSMSMSPPAAGDGGLGPPRKRKRRVVSCAECHRRKQKCDRNQPCRACVDRKMETSCHYETTAMSHERHHMRVIEAATYGRSLQEGGSLPVKAAGFGYAHTADNTLGFLRKIDGHGHGRRSGSGSGSGSGSIGSLDGLDGLVSISGIGSIGGIGGIDRLGSDLDRLSGLIEDGGGGIVTTTTAEAAALAEQQHLQSQQPQEQALSQPHAHPHNHNHSHSQTGDPYAVTDRYRSLIRELPPRQYIDRLVEVYFHDFNWHYYALDEDVFLQRLADWSDGATGPFGTLQPPHQLSADLRAFPALLFQVLAVGLLVLPADDPDGFFDPIKHPGNTTLDSLAMDYSEAGNAILALLGKRQMSLTTVMAAFLRAAFLKYVALITEAWHAIGSAIRDAQEIGLHRTSLDPKPWTQTAEAVLANEWEIQSRRRTWMTLVSWDVHMGVVLGRPTTVDLSDRPVLPVDCVLPTSQAERATMPVQPRGEDDAPTPLTRAIWAFQAIEPLRAILALEKDGPVPRDFGAVDALHDELVQLQAAMPPYFRLENPDRRFDGLPECHWLPAVRVALPQVTVFNLIALHRHYVFTRARSRTEGLHACLAMLQVQRVHFATLRPQQYRMFSLFFGTFDSLVLLASIYILFPREHPELIPATIQHFRWSVERFELMADHFSLARSALGVLQAIYLRLRKTLGIRFLEGGGSSSCSAPNGGSAADMTNGSNSNNATSIDLLTLSNIDPSLQDEGTPLLGGTAAMTREDVVTGPSPSASSSSSSEPTPGAFSSVSGPSSAASVATDVFGAAMAAAEAAAAPPPQPQPLLDPALQDTAIADSSTLAPFDLDTIFPDGFDWTSFQPICPTGDLTYNILMGVSDGTTAMPTWAGSLGGENGQNVVSVEPVGVGGDGDGDGDGGGGGDDLEAAAAAAATSIDGTAVPWQFEGDFASNSIWGLLNIYTPF